MYCFQLLLFQHCCDSACRHWKRGSYVDFVESYICIAIISIYTDKVISASQISLSNFQLIINFISLGILDINYHRNEHRLKTVIPIDHTIFLILWCQTHSWLILFQEVYSYETIWVIFHFHIFLLMLKRNFVISVTWTQTRNSLLN